MLKVRKQRHQDQSTTKRADVRGRHLSELDIMWRNKGIYRPFVIMVVLYKHSTTITKYLSPPFYQCLRNLNCSFPHCWHCSVLSFYSRFYFQHTMLLCQSSASPVSNRCQNKSHLCQNDMGGTKVPQNVCSKRKLGYVDFDVIKIYQIVIPLPRQPQGNDVFSNMCGVDIHHTFTP